MGGEVEPGGEGHENGHRPWSGTSCRDDRRWPPRVDQTFFASTALKTVRLTLGLVYAFFMLSPPRGFEVASRLG